MSKLDTAMIQSCWAKSWHGRHLKTPKIRDDNARPSLTAIFWAKIWYDIGVSLVHYFASNSFVIFVFISCRWRLSGNFSYFFFCCTFSLSGLSALVSLCFICPCSLHCLCCLWHDSGKPLKKKVISSNFPDQEDTIKFCSIIITSILQETEPQQHKKYH